MKIALIINENSCASREYLSGLLKKNIKIDVIQIGKFSKNNIIHIGDSLEADIEGANAYGIKSKLIDPINKDLILFLRNYRN